MNELEANIVLSLVNQPGLVQTNEVQPNWFRDGRLAKLVRFLNDTHGDFKGFAPLRASFNQAYPNVIREQDWATLAKSQSYNYQFKGYLKDLKQTYLRTQLGHAATNYSLNPNGENYQQLKLCMDALDEPDTKPEVSIKDIGDKLKYDLEHPVKAGIKTFGMLDDRTYNGLRGGNLLTIGARPSVGKSAFAINLAWRALRSNDDMTIDFFSLEMSGEDVYKRLTAINTGINKRSFVNPKLQLDDHQKAMVRESIQYFNKKGLAIHDNFMTIEEIAGKIKERAATARQGRYLAIVDYLQLVESSRFRDNRQQQVALVSRQLKLLTQTLNVPIIMLSQLNRGVESRMDKTPTMSDLRETGAIEQDSNMIAFLYREDDSNADKQEEILIFDMQKNREGTLGKNQLRFQKKIQTMRETF